MIDPFSFLYKTGFRLSQHRRSLQTQRLPIPVISVGGLSVGGSGKTPVVEAVAKILLSIERDPVILSRGYRRRSGRAFEWWQAGEERGDELMRLGDEPAMIAEQLPRGAIIVGKKRAAAFHAFEARVRRLHDPVVILDDGFQHLQIKRDIDILVIDDSVLKSPGLLPFGRLREPLCGATRADMIVQVGSPSHAIEAIPKASHQKYTISVVDTPPAYPADETTVRNLDELRFLLVTGIARSGRVLETVRRRGLQTEDHMVFRDHHTYTHGDVDRIIDRARQCNANALLTTRKDLVKLRGFPDLMSRLWVLSYELRPGDAFCRDLIERINTISTSEQNKGR